ncbi:hypothetical protein [Deinococcus arcticus]|uniref:DUF5666 domain-containing protein n=1 Tax=Deinococcus arcticus TaxID=2136176 RepID=A0A2T3WB80_9DEIO|nr:hypothetical protein [Deinococcus arcticus]PTA69064.1 hypothetical protein C8263_04550 [Deinococcus arcticus]
MKPTLLALITAALLASCAPQNEGETTTTETTTTETTTDTGTETTETTTESTDTATTEGTTDAADDAADPGADSTLTNSDDANASEEVDMAVGDGLEGTVTDFDGTAQTFTLNENDANYAVQVSADTVYEGTATSADEFFGTDRADANVAVEGDIDESTNTLNATKITLN